MTELQACDFKDPGSLKDILELLDKLGKSRTLKNSVGQKLLKDVQEYFKDSLDSGLTSSLGLVFTNANFIRRSILKNYGTYDTYSHISGGHTDCAEKISEALKTWLPKAYAALYYLYFMCSNDCKSMQGGEWSGQNVNESGLSGTDLFSWLTKEQKTLSGSSKPFTPGLVPRGFSTGNLDTSNKGQNVADAIKTIISHESTGPLQKALSYLLFVCPWDNALLGHACLFLHKFCSEVAHPTGGQKNFEGYSEELKDVCRELSGSLQPFVQGSSQSHISAVSQGSNVYSGVFNDDSLDDYCDWLRKNLKNIIEALKDMSTDCKTWGITTPFEYGYTAGPFLYGFVPKDKSWMTHIDKNLQGPITSLIESLEKLEKALQTSSSTAAAAAGAAGGIFGLGGAGAGAAYGLNLFGFKNLVTGLISGFLK